MSYIYILCFFIFIFSIIITISSNLIFSVLSLICSAISISFLLFYLNFEFLPYLILMIYVGAVSILFLFITMTVKLNLHYYTNFSIVKKIIYWLTFIKISTFYNTFFINVNSITTTSYSITWVLNFISYRHSDIFIFANSLYYYFSIHTILISCILLIGMISSIMLCLPHQKIVKK